MPEVSIITPVYNGERYLGEAIKSVLAQTWQDWELIVIDDGSTDETPNILRSFGDPRIVCIRQENQGAARARNTGLDAARGEYIAFLDADDLYLPSALADLAHFLRRNPQYDVVFSDGHVCDETGRTQSRLSEVRPGVYTGDILEPLVLTSSVITVPVCTMTRRTSIERYEARFDDKLVLGEDRDFWIQLARHVQFGYLDKLTCSYRVHQTSTQRTSGQARGKHDALYLQMKVLHSDWFGELSTSTRRQFFHRLLIRRLEDLPVQQEAVLESEQLRHLPPQYQAELWRQVATDHLLRRTEQGFASRCLRQASRLWPGDRKSRFLLWTLHLGDPVPYYLLRLARALHRAIHGVRSTAQRKPKPVLAAVGAVSD